jgi:hypothetical protein
MSQGYGLGFFDFLCDWIQKILTDGSVSIKINNTTGPYFQSAKGVMQGDPLSPFLFNVVVQCLAKMVTEGQQNDLLVGLARDIIDKGVAIIQYAYDTVICITHDPEKAINSNAPLSI